MLRGRKGVSRILGSPFILLYLPSHLHELFEVSTIHAATVSSIRYVMKAPNCPGMGASRDRGVNGVTADGKGETLIDLPHL